MPFLRCSLAAGAAALSFAPCEAPAAAQPGATTGWWYAGRSGEAPQRQLFFIDRGTVRAQRGEASARAMSVFEQPRGDVKAFAITYAFRCAARQFQTRDAVFTTVANTQEPASGIVDDWSVVVPGSVAATLLDAACFGRMSNEARRIAGTPLVQAGQIFAGAMTPTPAPATARRLVPRHELTCRLRHGETAQQVSQHPDPTPLACRSIPASAASASQVAKQTVCRGRVYFDGRVARAFTATIAFEPGVLVIEINSNGQVYSRRYPYSMAAGGNYRVSFHNGGWILFNPGRRTYEANWIETWEGDDVDPNNPFPVEYSQRVEYSGICS